MSLSHVAVTNAKAKQKPYMLSDGDGLDLLVNETGSKLWRLRFRYAGKANMLSLGSFPTVSLLDARKRRDDVKRQLANGINPSLNRKLEKLSAAVAAQNTFGAIADEYLANLEARQMA